MSARSHSRSQHTMYRGSSFFFFFQAEDGMRFLTVTGVQTCALPISGRPSLRAVASNVRILEATARTLGLPAKKLVVTVDHHGNTSAASVPLALDEFRSEERRVGKECRSRWSPDP